MDGASPFTVFVEIKQPDVVNSPPNCSLRPRSRIEPCPAGEALSYTCARSAPTAAAPNAPHSGLPREPSAMTSLPEPHIDRTEEPILTGTGGYSPKRVRWPGLLAVAILVSAAAGGVMVTEREERKHSTNTHAAAPQQRPAETANTPQRDADKDAQSSKGAAPK
jgi:hypothetical protein